MSMRTGGIRGSDMQDIASEQLIAKKKEIDTGDFGVVYVKEKPERELVEKTVSKGHWFSKGQIGIQIKDAKGKQVLGSVSIKLPFFISSEKARKIAELVLRNIRALGDSDEHGKIDLGKISEISAEEVARATGERKAGMFEKYVAKKINQYIEQAKNEQALLPLKGLDKLQELDRSLEYLGIRYEPFDHKKPTEESAKSIAYNLQDLRSTFAHYLMHGKSTELEECKRRVDAIDKRTDENDFSDIDKKLIEDYFKDYYKIRELILEKYYHVHAAG